MKLLVLAEKYSTKDKVSQGFIHTRNCEYKNNGIELDVISFCYTGEKYDLDGINVYSEKEFYNNKNIDDYDVVISHAPNIKHHCKFINKNNNKIKKVIFFFHGHEVLYCDEIYPKPYDYVKKENKIKETIRRFYDVYKIIYMSKFLKKLLNKSQLVFVSEWMYSQFKKNIKIDEDLYRNKSYIIYNALGTIFLDNDYDRNKVKEYDFITIRNNIDGSKYCIDLINNLAANNPKFKFLVVGKGQYFEHNKAADNLTFMNKNLNHKEIIEYLNMSKCALMPTRADAQGVMMCEMATFGIPVITSDIYVCQKVLGDLENVQFIDNDNPNVDLKSYLQKFKNKKHKKSEKFSYDNTIMKEISLINAFIGDTCE